MWVARREKSLQETDDLKRKRHHLSLRGTPSSTEPGPPRGGEMIFDARRYGVLTVPSRQLQVNTGVSNNYLQRAERRHWDSQNVPYK